MRKPRRDFRRTGSAFALAAAALLASWQIMAGGVSYAAQSPAAADIAYRLREENDTAAARAATLALMSNRPDRAQRLALGALARSPINVAALRTLGELRNRRASESGDRLMIEAASLGWRDVATQLWIVQRSLVTQDWTIAIQRAEALLRVEHDSRVTFGLVRLLLIQPSVRPNFVTALAQRPFWRHDFLWAQVDTLPRPQLLALADVLDDLGRTRAPPNIIEARSTIDALHGIGETDRAWAIYARLAPWRRERGLLSNSGFEAPGLDYTGGGSSTVFDWRVFEAEHASGELERIADERKNRALLAITDGQAAAPVASRALVLKPGSYRIGFRYRSLVAATEPAFAVTVACPEGAQLGRAETRQGAQADRWLRGDLRFTVPVGCRSQMLQIAATAANGVAAEAYFDDIVLDPA